MLISVVCLYLFVCVCVFPFPIFHSDLDCPDAWVFSGLLLFSCSLRYLFHCLSPSTFKPSFFPIFTCFWPQTRRPQIRKRYTRMFVYLCRYSKRPAHRLMHTCTHGYAFRDNIITGYMHLGTPTVYPCAHSTIWGAQESIRSQLLCNWVRY